MRKTTSIDHKRKTIDKLRTFFFRGLLIILFLMANLILHTTAAAKLLETLNPNTPVEDNSQTKKAQDILVKGIEIGPGFKQFHVSGLDDYGASVSFKSSKMDITINVYLTMKIDAQAHQRAKKDYQILTQEKMSKPGYVVEKLSLDDASCIIKVGDRADYTAKSFPGNIWVLEVSGSYYSFSGDYKENASRVKTAVINAISSMYRRFESPIDEVPFGVFPLGGDLEGSELADGDVVLHITDFDHPNPLPIEVKGKPPGLKAGETYEVQVRMNNWHKDLISIDGAQLKKTTFGYSFESSDKTNNLNLNFHADRLREYRSLFPGGPAVVVPMTIGIGEEATSFFVQLSPWEMMITRFEIRERSSESTREFNARKKRRQEIDYRFNDYIALKGKLWDSWNENLHPMVKIRPQGEPAGQGNAFGPNEAVVMGWAINETTGHTFLTAEDDPQQNLEGVPAYRSEAELFAEFDLEIVLDPKAQTKKNPANSEFVLDEDTRISDLEKQPEIWRDFRIDGLEITVHEVDPQGEDMRLTAGQRYAVGGPIATKVFGREEISDYVRRKVIDLSTRELIYEGDIPAFRFGPIRKPGIYEIRMYIKVTRKADMEDFREVEVAIRILVKKSDFGVRVIHWTTQRGKR